MTTLCAKTIFNMLIHSMINFKFGLILCIIQYLHKIKILKVKFKYLLLLLNRLWVC